MPIGDGLPLTSKPMLARLLLLAYLCLPTGAVAAPVMQTAEQIMRDFGVQLPKQRKPAPDFTLPGLAGGEVRLSDYRGKLVLLHFWATWCIPCRQEMPWLHAMEKTMPASEFRMICVNVDRGSRELVRSFIEEVSPSFHTLLDPEGLVRNRYAVRGLPTTYLIGPDGTMMGRMIGERDWTSEAAQHMLNFLLGEHDSHP